MHGANLTKHEYDKPTDLHSVANTIDKKFQIGKKLFFCQGQICSFFKDMAVKFRFI